MTGNRVFTLLLFAVALCAAAPALGDRYDPGQTARRGRGSDDYLEKAPPASPAQAAPEAGDPKAKALFEAKCSICHPTSRPLGKNKDRNGWTSTVTRMQQVNGCPITDAEAKTIIDYLVAVRGPTGTR